MRLLKIKKIVLVFLAICPIFALAGEGKEDSGVVKVSLKVPRTAEVSLANALNIEIPRTGVEGTWGAAACIKGTLTKYTVTVKSDSKKDTDTSFALINSVLTDKKIEYTVRWMNGTKRLEAQNGVPIVNQELPSGICTSYEDSTHNAGYEIHIASNATDSAGTPAGTYVGTLNITIAADQT